MRRPDRGGDGDHRVEEIKPLAAEAAAAAKAAMYVGLFAKAGYHSTQSQGRVGSAQWFSGMPRSILPACERMHATSQLGPMATRPTSAPLLSQTSPLASMRPMNSPLGA